MSEIQPNIDHAAIEQHLDILFGKDADGFVCLRGIGEKGTPREGVFREDIFLEPSRMGWDKFVSSIIFHATRWGQHDVATFVVPCTLKADRGTAENCHTFRTLCADFDTGDTDAKLEWIARECGPPNLVVLSGGTTEEGKPKRHVYWSVTPTQDVAGIVSVRDAIARKAGADIQFGLGVESNPFGRAHQPIRLAGSIHGKNAVRRAVIIESETHNDVQSDLSVYAQAMDRATPSSWALPDSVGRIPEDELLGAASPKAKDLLTTDVAAGGEGATTRWSAFNGVAGHYIHTARLGEMTIDEAKLAAFGWMQAHMNPPWPDARFNTEWQSLLRHDLSSNGPFPEPEKPLMEEGKGLAVWAAHRWSMGDAPARQYLVDGLLLAGKHHMLVSEGGAGKTFLMLDLAMKVASKQPGDAWCGMPINRRGAAVIMTTEDDKDEIHVRLADMDPTGERRKEAGDDLIILPTINNGGAFALVERDPRTQEARPSRKWLEFFNLLRQIPNLQLVVIDTLNSVLHGEENSATVTNEFIRVASQVCGELGACLIIPHHIRKQGDEPIRNAGQMLSAVRGSSALPAAFRAVLGIWHCSDFDRRMKTMGIQAKRGHLWKMAILKANTPMLDGERTLLRSETGLLVDVTDRDKFNDVNFHERHAWLLAAITLAARAGHPYSIEGKNAKSGLYRRRAELPELLRNVGPGEFAHLVDEMLLSHAIAAAAAKGGKDKKWLDTPTGPIADDEVGADLSSGAYEPPDWDTYTFDPDTREVIRKS
jgi:hypothetical protein